MAQKKIKNRDIEKGKEPKGLPISPIPRPLNIENYPILSKMFEHMDGGIFEVFRHYLDPSKKGFKQIQLDRMRGILTDEDPRAPINAEGASEQEILERERLLQDVDKYRDKKIYTAKGGSIPQQMELFSEGGLKDEGNTVDPVSGNDVPPGATQEEVRDDIPAQLSEGEFVFPADVVRYIGLEKLMMMRQEAKAGLKRMEEMGQMGNSEEATLPDDMPFEMADLDMRDETEEDVLKANVGAFVPPRFPTSKAYSPTANPYMRPDEITFAMPYAPYQPGQAQEILAPAGGGTGQVETEYRRFVQKETGQVRMIPFNKATGTSLYPIDALLNQGFVREDEKPKEVAKTAKVATTKVKPVEQDSGDDGSPSPSGAVDATGIELNKSAIKSTSLVGFLDTVKPLAQFRDTFKGPAYALFESKVQGVSPRTGQLLSSSIGGVLDDFRGGNVSITDKGLLSGNYANTTPLHELTTEQQNRLGIVGERVVSVVQPLVQTLNEKTGKYENTLTLEEQKANINKKAKELGVRTTQKGTNISRRPETIIREIAKVVAKQEQDKVTNIQKIFDEQGDSSYEDTGQSVMSDFGSAAEQAAEDFEPVAKGGLLKKKPKVKRMKKGGLASKK